MWICIVPCREHTSKALSIITVIHFMPSNIIPQLSTGTVCPQSQMLEV